MFCQLIQVRNLPRWYLMIHAIKLPVYLRPSFIRTSNNNIDGIRYLSLKPGQLLVVGNIKLEKKIFQIQ